MGKKVGENGDVGEEELGRENGADQRRREGPSRTVSRRMQLAERSMRSMLFLRKFDPLILQRSRRTEQVSRCEMARARARGGCRASERGREERRAARGRRWGAGGGEGRRDLVLISRLARMLARVSHTCGRDGGAREREGAG